jgi:uncharacterized damage-inducible protein DinB
MDDAFLSAARELLDETLSGILEALDGLSTEQLNATLDLDGANSLAVIAVHATKSARSWTAVAMGAPLPERDRPAEFRTVASSRESLLAELRDVREEVRGVLAGEPALAWDELRPTHPRVDGSTEPVSGAWALLHTMEHAREHLSQMWLTRQVLEDGRLS